MMRVLLRGKCEGGLYPFPALEHFVMRSALSTVWPWLKCWHDRLGHPWHDHLGHPSSVIVQRVHSDNKLAFSKESTSDVVCDACQCGKSHQRPFPRYVSVSKTPLELVFSDVWGPGPTSVGRNKFYVSFIDDYSKFTWIFLLKHEYEVFTKFHQFQQHVERLLN
jgi:hypothetical protein